MGVRDRFFTATTAKAILSWRILAGAAAGVVAGLLGVPWLGAVAIGVVVYVGAVALAVPKPATRPQLDPFALSEPWRQFVQSAQRSKRQLADTVRAARAGPLRDRLQGIVDRLDDAIVESWQIARRGDEIDSAVRALDPPRLRSRLDTLRTQATSAPERRSRRGDRLGREPGGERRSAQAAVGEHRRPAPAHPGPARRAGLAGGRGQHRGE